MIKKNSEATLSLSSSVSTSSVGLKQKLKKSDLNLPNIKETANSNWLNELDSLWNIFRKKYDIYCLKILKNDQAVLEALIKFSKQYKISITPDFDLICDNKGDILNDARLWIIFIHTNLSRFNYHKIVKFFENATEKHEINEINLFFEYFLLIVNYFSKEEIDSLNCQKIPKKFVELYEKLKYEIYQTIDYKELDSSHQFLNETYHDNNRLKHDFSFSKIVNEDNTFESNKKDNNVNLNFSKSEKESENFNMHEFPDFKWNDNIINENKSPTNHEKNLENDSNNLNLLLEEDVLLEKINFNMNNLLIREDADMKFDKYLQSDQKNNESSLSQEQIIEDIHESFYIVDKNFNNNDNFAILKLTENTQRNYKTPYVILPLRIFTNELSSQVNQDLKEIMKSDYQNFTYKPFKPQITNIVKEKSTDTQSKFSFII